MLNNLYSYVQSSVVTTADDVLWYCCCRSATQKEILFVVRVHSTSKRVWMQSKRNTKTAGAYLYIVETDAKWRHTPAVVLVNATSLVSSSRSVFLCFRLLPLCACGASPRSFYGVLVPYSIYRRVDDHKVNHRSDLTGSTHLAQTISAWNLV